VSEPDVIYRVSLDPALGHVDIMTLGVVGVDVTDPLERTYGCIGELPMWVQEKLALLMMTPDNTTTGAETVPIDGVGRRIARNVFWIYP